MARPFKPNRAFKAEVRRYPGLHRAVGKAARSIAREAEALSDAIHEPWMPRQGSGTSKTFVVDEGGETVRVVNTEHGGHLAEFGSTNNPAHAPLRRAVRATGHRLDEHPK